MKWHVTGWRIRIGLPGCAAEMSRWHELLADYVYFRRYHSRRTALRLALLTAALIRALEFGAE